MLRSRGGRAGRRGGRSLLGRLVATFLLLSVAMVGVVGTLAYVRARASLQESVYSRLAAAQDLTTASLERWVQEQRRNIVFASGLTGGAVRDGTVPDTRGSVQLLLDPTSSPRDRAAAADAVRATLSFAVGQTADAQELFLIDLDGRIVVSTNNAHEGLDESAQDYVRNGGSAVFITPISALDLTEGRPTMVVAAPLFDETGQRQGILAGVLDLARLDRIVLQRTGLGQGGRTYLVGADNHLVHGGSTTSTDLAVASTGIDDALAHRPGRGLYSDYQDTAVIGTYTWLPVMGAALVSEIPQSVAFAPAKRLGLSIGVIGIVVVVLLAFLIFLAARRIARPILAITRTAEAVRGGDLSREAPVTTRDEVGTLAVTFNEMTSQLRDSVVQLERRVDERTAELRTQKRYFETLVEISPAAVVTMDTDLRVTGWNPAATQLFGYDPDDALGRPIGELVVPEAMRAEGADVARRALTDGRVDAITRRVRKDGTPVDVEIIMVPLVVDGTLVGSYAVYHDITELEAARQDADSANEAKSTFLATMSHEIRTPMNAIIGMSGLLVETDLDGEQREYAEAINGSGEALLAIINDILDFSKIEAGRMDLDPQPFELASCLESALDLVVPTAAAKGLSLGYDVLEGTPVRVVGDSVRLRQILLNLLSNALKFTESGHVVLTAGPAGPTGLQIAVTDTGIGLTPEQQGRLFQSFSQADVSTSRRYGGTGLGLAISRRLAGLMGGTVSVESPVADGRGSRFQLTVQVEVEQPAAPPTHDPALAGHTVLLTEPDPALREILVTRLHGWGCEVLPEDGEPDGSAPDVRLLDAASADAATVSAPGSAGALVLMSTLSRRDTAARFGWEVPAGAGWVTKPVKPAVLLAALRAALGAGVPSAAIEVAAARSAEVLADRHPLRLLLVEDNALNRKLALALLGRLGYPADVATTGSEAVTAAADRPYDVILMDVQMPDMDGLEATQRILATTTGPRPWIVALTANVLDADREACAAAGMSDFLTKPIRPQELADVLERSPIRDDPAVDWGTLRTHVRGMAGMDDHELERDLADDFVTGAPVLLAAIDTGLEVGDPTDVRRAAHTLKSHAALFGATQLETLSRRLEELAAAAEPGDEMPAVAQALRAETDRVCDQLATPRPAET